MLDFSHKGFKSPLNVKLNSTGISIRYPYYSCSLLSTSIHPNVHHCYVMYLLKHTSYTYFMNDLLATPE